MRFMRHEKIHNLSDKEYTLEEKIKFVLNEIYNLTKESHYTVDIYHYNTNLDNKDNIVKLYDSKRVNCIEISNYFDIRDLVNVIKEKYDAMRRTNMFNVLPSIVVIDNIDNVDKNAFQFIMDRMIIYFEFVNMFIYIF